MGDRSWEDYVNAVCVKGRPGKIGDLALDWEALFRNAASVTQSLRDGIRDLKQHWKGPAADDYFGKLDALAKQIEQIETDNNGIIQLLQQARDALSVAQTTMPVPDYMLDEVQGRQAQLDAANAAGARDVISGLTFGAATPLLFVPDSFMKPLADSFIGDWGREAFGHFTAWWDDWDGSMTNQSRDIFNTADRSYAQGAATTEQPRPATGSMANTTNPLNLNPGGPGPGASPFGGLHPGASGVDLNKGPGSNFDPNADPFGDPSSDLGSDLSSDPAHLPGTGLSGAGGGGFTGAGGGLGGAGGALGSGAGLTSAGAAGIGGGAAGIGRPVSPPAMMAPFGGMGGAGGAGAASRAARGTGARAGMVGGPHGAGTGAGEDDRSSWLTEDEDIWGGADGAPPGILK